jgi:hypothetical protein
MQDRICHCRAPVHSAPSGHLRTEGAARNLTQAETRIAVQLTFSHFPWLT